MERDEETGLAYHSARYYVPWLGRWSASDPLGTIDGPNRFAYSNGDPVGSFDKAGTSTTDPDLKLYPTGDHYAPGPTPQAQVDGPVDDVWNFEDGLNVTGSVETPEPQPITRGEACARHHDAWCSVQEQHDEWVGGELHFQGRKPIQTNTALKHLGILAVAGIVAGTGAVFLAPLATGYGATGAVIVGAGDGAITAGTWSLTHEVVRQRDEHGSVQDWEAAADATAGGTTIGAATGGAFVSLAVVGRGLSPLRPRNIAINEQVSLGVAEAQLSQQGLHLGVPPRHQYQLLDLVQTELDFSTAPNSAVFWSGNHMNLAQGFGRVTGKTTIEQTVGGRYLESLNLFQSGAWTPKQAAEIWNFASRRFASGATGTVYAFTRGTDSVGQYGLRTFFAIEYPRLKVGVRLGKANAPGSWPTRIIQF